MDGPFKISLILQIKVTLVYNNTVWNCCCTFSFFRMNEKRGIQGQLGLFLVVCTWQIDLESKTTPVFCGSENKVCCIA